MPDPDFGVPKSSPPPVPVPSQEPANTAAPALDPKPKPSSTPKRKLHPWEVDSPIPPPEERPMPKFLLPVFRGYAWFISTPKRRKYWINFVRAVLVVGMMVAVTAEIYPELTNASSPTLAADPLTLTTSLAVHAENCSALSGFVNGDDVIQGNFSITGPAGGSVEFYVLNSSNNGNWISRIPNAVWGLNGAVTNGQVDFTAAYSDYYTFLFINPNPSNETVYVVFNYLSSLPPA